MQELQNLRTTQLVDLLAEQTFTFTRMVAEKKFGEEYERQKLFLKAIQTEIDSRKNKASAAKTNITAAPDFS